MAYAYATSTTDDRLITPADGAFIILRELVYPELPVYLYTAEDYRQQLLSLLPRGPAWNDAGSAMLGELAAGLTLESERVGRRMIDLIVDAYPSSTVELLQDWERALGLPDACVTTAQNAGERRAAVVSKLTRSSNPTPAFFVGLAAGLGYGATVIEYNPALAGLAVIGDRVFSEDWESTWAIQIPGDYTVVRYAEAGSAVIGDALATWGEDALECTILQYKPAHTTVIFIYGDE